MLDFFEDMAMTRQKLIVFRSPFDRSWFPTEGANVELVLRAGVEKSGVELTGQARLARDSPEGFMTAGQGTLGRFDTHFMNFLPCLVGCFLHDTA